MIRGSQNQSHSKYYSCVRPVQPLPRLPGQPISGLKIDTLITAPNVSAAATRQRFRNKITYNISSCSIKALLVHEHSKKNAHLDKLPPTALRTQRLTPRQSRQDRSRPWYSPPNIGLAISPGAHYLTGYKGKYWHCTFSHIADTHTSLDTRPA